MGSRGSERMNSEHGTVYMIRGRDDEWVSPEPAERVISDTVADATGLAADEIDSIDAYVDTERLRAVVGDGDDETVSFEVEGHEVTVTADGTVTVE